MTEDQIKNIHLTHEIEQLRGRMIRMMEEHADMLTTAQAMRKGKTEVAAERVEFVVETMRDEVQKLRTR